MSYGNLLNKSQASVKEDFTPVALPLTALGVFQEVTVGTSFAGKVVFIMFDTGGNNVTIGCREVGSALARHCRSDTDDCALWPVIVDDAGKIEVTNDAATTTASIVLIMF